MKGTCSWCNSEDVEVIKFDDVRESPSLCPYCSLNYPIKNIPNTLRSDLSRMLNLLEKRLKEKDERIIK